MIQIINHSSESKSIVDLIFCIRDFMLFFAKISDFQRDKKLLFFI